MAHLNIYTFNGTKWRICEAVVRSFTGVPGIWWTPAPGFSGPNSVAPKVSIKHSHRGVHSPWIPAVELGIRYHFMADDAISFLFQLGFMLYTVSGLDIDIYIYILGSALASLFAISVKSRNYFLGK